MAFIGFSLKDRPICKGKQLSNISQIFFRLMVKSHNAIPEPCTTMEIGIVPQVWTKKDDNKTLKWQVFFKAKYTEIIQEQIIEISKKKKTFLIFQLFCVTCS